MKKYTLILLSIVVISCQNTTPPKQEEFKTTFEISNGAKTETYQSGIDFFKKLDNAFPQMKLLEYGKTDAGKPLHLAVLSPDADFNPQSEENKKKLVMMINNAIHPGEPDGVDATLRLFRDLLFSPDLSQKLDGATLIAIPFYNIGGALNRNSTTRVNQEGPESYGFRGNAQNLDLNRDFIKSDSRNARTFAEIFNLWNPDVFVDTHVSNGADYQYTLTYLSTQEDKLGNGLGTYMREKLAPALFESMKQDGKEIIPYVNVWGSIPDSGYVQFLDNPRYSTGYTTLHHTIGMMTETHMLKPFKQRTEHTYSFLSFLLDYSVKNKDEIRQLRADAIAQSMQQTEFPILWESRKDTFTTMNFKGYEATYKPSEVTTGNRLFYNRSKPFDKEIKWFNFYQPKLAVQKPEAYIIPQGWHEVIDLLKLNGVEMARLENDSAVSVASYKIEDFKTSERPYEKHYPHREVKVSKETSMRNFRAGDYLIGTNQAKVRFIVETLEPQAVDSYFNWNFFDAILQAKEGYSAYVFEDKAVEILENNLELKASFEKKKQEEPDFAQNPQWQLYYIYQNSLHAEEAYNTYPVFRVE